jgi:hypothetical protein
VSIWLQAKEMIHSLGLRILPLPVVVRIFVATLLFLGTLGLTPAASANSLEPCRIKASERQTLSLGFPVRAERLVNVAKPRILVVPFQLKDHPSFVFSQQDIQDYTEASKNILALSNGKANIEIVIAPTYKSEFSIETMNTLKLNQMIGYRNQDESISTYGFVRRFVSAVDPTIDFTGFDAVIFDGSIRQTPSSSDIAEAFLLYSDPRNNFVRPIQTNEKSISNVILLSNHNTVATITHEILHLFGLTDLYGTSTGPNELSLMSSNEITLTTYEKWILGWLPDTEVQCLSNPSSNSITEFKFDAAKSDQLLVIPDNAGSHLMIESSKVRGSKRLAFFSLNNENRPPMEFFPVQQLGNTGRTGLAIDDINSIGDQIISPKYTLIVSDITQETATFKLAPRGLVGSAQFNEMLKQIADSKSLAQSKLRQMAEERAAAELKAKQDADAKAAAELKAKQDADAKAAAEIKAKQEADAKAAVKKITITCTKGKLTKKVTAVKPKCPAGYKLKK